jgi:AcrR family transcriptional regulator
VKRAVTRRAPGRPQNARGTGFTLRGELLRAGLELLAARGDEEDVTVRGVARLTGVTPTSVYRHFSGSADLAISVVAEAFQSFQAVINEAISTPDTPREQLRAGVDAYLKFAADQPGLYRVVFQRNKPQPNPGVRALADDVFATLITIIDAATPASLTPNALRQRAIWLWIQMHGIATLIPSHPRFDWPARETLVTQLVDQALRHGGT